MSNTGKHDYQGKPRIKTWKKFAKLVRANGCNLLSKIDSYPESVLITGCQRSGGTMLARIITSSDEMQDFSWGPDDELDAALILSGYVAYPTDGRFCFQTTYLNECYHEYFRHTSSFKVVWLVRNPYSVVFSLLHNWSRFALNELFAGCGVTQMNDREKSRYERFGMISINRLKRACYSYNAKSMQIYEILDKLGADNVLVIEYDDLVRNKEQVLPMIYDFVGLDYKEKYGDPIRTSSLSKAGRLSLRERNSIEEFCMPVYEKVKMLCKTAL